jgi:hypothetical protein
VPADPVEQRRRRLMAAGVVALLGTVIWIFAALGLPTAYAAIPTVLALLALGLLVAALRLRTRTTGGGRTRVTPELVVLALVALAGLVVLVL